MIGISMNNEWLIKFEVGKQYFSTHYFSSLIEMIFHEFLSIFKEQFLMLKLSGGLKSLISIPTYLYNS